MEEIRDNTGFDFDLPRHCPLIAGPNASQLELLRSRVRHEVEEVYPRFAALQ